MARSRHRSPTRYGTSFGRVSYGVKQDVGEDGKLRAATRAGWDSASARARVDLRFARAGPPALKRTTLSAACVSESSRSQSCALSGTLFRAPHAPQALPAPLEPRVSARCTRHCALVSLVCGFGTSPESSDSRRFRFVIHCERAVQKAFRLGSGRILFLHFDRLRFHERVATNLRYPIPIMTGQ